jgi:hypothetical protein
MCPENVCFLGYLCDISSTSIQEHLDASSKFEGIFEGISLVDDGEIPSWD